MDRFEAPLHQCEGERLPEHIDLKGFRAGNFELTTEDLQAVSGNEKLAYTLPARIAGAVRKAAELVPGAVSLFQRNATNGFRKIGGRRNPKRNVSEFTAARVWEWERDLTVE